jgi:hypothetical protein
VRQACWCSTDHNLSVPTCFFQSSEKNKRFCGPRLNSRSCEGLETEGYQEHVAFESRLLVALGRGALRVCDGRFRLLGLWGGIGALQSSIKTF